MNYNSRLHQIACYWASKGKPVFPLAANSKKPLKGSHGWKDATLDAHQITNWWRSNPNYNVGVTGVAVVDCDIYKGGPEPATFIPAQYLDTLTVQSPRGGKHLWYELPEGLHLKSIQNWPYQFVDIKADNSYIVAPGSCVDGKQYTRISQTAETILLPDCLHALLSKPEVAYNPTPYVGTAPDAEEVRKALTYIPAQPGYETWVLLLMAVHSVLPDNDGIAICEEWSPGKRGEVRAKFKTFKPNGGTGIGTLFALAKQYGYTPPFTASRPLDEGIRQRLQQAQPVDAHEKVLIDLAIEQETLTPYTTTRSIGEKLNTSAMSVSRQWKVLEKKGRIRVIAQEKGTRIDVTGMSESVTVVTNSSLVISKDREDLGNNYCNAFLHTFFADYADDDAFTQYPMKYAQKRRKGQELLHAPGPSALKLLPHMKEWACKTFLHKATGLCRETIATTLGYLDTLGLLETSEESHGKRITRYYRFVADFRERLEEIRPRLHTHLIGQFRVARHAAEIADWAQHNLRLKGHLMEPASKAWLQKRFEDQAFKADVICAFLLTQGFNPYIKVSACKGIKRSKQRWDYKEAWLTWGRQLWDAFNALVGDYHEKLRQLTLAYAKDAAVEKYNSIRKEVREKLDMAIMMSYKRVEYEAKPVEVEEVEEVVEVLPQGGQLAFAYG